MARKPAHLTAGAQLNAREAVWAEMRRRKRFTMNDLAVATGIAYGTIRTYVIGLERAGYVAREPEKDARRKKSITYVSNQFLSRRYKLVRDTGVEAPRVRRDGEVVTQGLSREAMWRTMRILREFSWRDLASMASTDDVSVHPEDARKYCQALRLAGYLITTSPGGPGKQERFRFVASRYSGPRAPMLQRVRQVFDPNLKRVVWPREVA